VPISQKPKQGRPGLAKGAYVRQPIDDVAPASASWPAPVAYITPHLLSHQEREKQQKIMSMFHEQKAVYRGFQGSSSFFKTFVAFKKMKLLDLLNIHLFYS